MYWVKSAEVNRPLVMCGEGNHPDFLCLSSVSLCLWSVNFPEVSQGFSLPALGGLSEMKLHISLSLLCSDNIRQKRLWFTSFPWKQALLRTSESFGVFQNGSFPPCSFLKHKGIFFLKKQKTKLGQTPGGKSHKIVGSLYEEVPLEVFTPNLVYTDPLAIC